MNQKLTVMDMWFIFNGLTELPYSILKTHWKEIYHEKASWEELEVWIEAFVGSQLIFLFLMSKFDPFLRFGMRASW